MKEERDDSSDKAKDEVDSKETSNVTSSPEPPVDTSAIKPETEPPPHKQLAWRHVLFRASANSVYLATTMFISVLLYGLLVIFFVPTDWLVEKDWQVFKSLGALVYLMVISLIFFPVSLAFQLLIAGMVQDFKRYKWQMEIGGLAAALLLCILFFWPGYFL